MVIDDADGRRVATFLNVVATLHEDGEPLSAGRPAEGHKIFVFHAPKSALRSSMADFAAIHSDGGYAGYVTNAGVVRYADAGYEEALDETARQGGRRFALEG